MAFLSEAQLERVVLDQLGGLGYALATDAEIGPDGRTPERDAYSDVILARRLAAAIETLNPAIPSEARTFEPYERFEASNVLIEKHVAFDAEAGEDGYLNVLIRLPGGDEIPLSIEASRLLFGVDREAYKTAVNACREAEKAELVGEPLREALS